jgi:hypothetical protein
VVLLIDSPGDALSEHAAEAVPQPVIDAVVKEVVKTVPAPEKQKR